MLEFALWRIFFISDSDWFFSLFLAWNFNNTNFLSSSATMRIWFLKIAWALLDCCSCLFFNPTSLSLLLYPIALQMALLGFSVIALFIASLVTSHNAQKNSNAKEPCERECTRCIGERRKKEEEEKSQLEKPLCHGWDLNPWALSPELSTPTTRPWTLSYARVRSIAARSGPHHCLGLAQSLLGVGFDSQASKVS